MRSKRLLDIVLALWVVFVGIVYYGGYWLPQTIGAATGRLTAVYAAMILVAAAVLCVRFLRREPPPADKPAPHKVDSDAGKLTKRGR